MVEMLLLNGGVKVYLVQISCTTKYVTGGNQIKSLHRRGYILKVLIVSKIKKNYEYA